MEDIDYERSQEGIKVLKLPKLTEEEKNIINPIIAPTSGLRIQIIDIKRLEKESNILTNRKLFLFLRMFKAISEKFKDLKENKNLKILIFTDDRPTNEILLRFCSEIFAYDGFEIYYQKNHSRESKISSPYGAASVALYEEIKLVIVLTASHNDLSWNGIKLYIDYPIPMSGDLFKEISRKALQVEEVKLQPEFTPIFLEAEEKNNEYIIDLLSKVIDIQSIKGKNIVIWPYLGEAKGIVNLFKYYGANLTVVDEDLNPPNPLKNIQESKLQDIMEKANSNIAILLDADRDRIVLYIKQNGEFYTYIPNEIYSAMHNILAKEFNKKLINVRTIPSDLRGDKSSFINILTGVGYKHLGIILYFLLGIEVDKSKIDTAILYFEDGNKNLVKIDNATPLRKQIIKLLENENKEKESFLMVYWEESGGHTLNILNVSKNHITGDYEFKTDFTIIADKYPVPALVLITELISRGYVISESIDWSIKGINQTIPANDEEKIRIMKNFEKYDGKSLIINQKEYLVHALSDNNDMIDIYQLKSENSTLYFRPSGTGPEVRFYIFGKRETHLNEIKTVQEFVKQNYL
ncbi:MAG: hypothetical protein ACFE9Z_00110 [Promethearchaeota archaeon]